MRTPQNARAPQGNSSLYPHELLAIKELDARHGQIPHYPEGFRNSFKTKDVFIWHYKQI